jgi:bifunctional DNA-binding transcriptional regulator/antitoxin component of YhaV-PrlF toxin-antitoxin module
MLHMPRKKQPDTFRFSAPLEAWKSKSTYYLITFPYVVEEVFGTKSRVRFTGTINGVPVEQALMPGRSGFHYISMGGALRRKLKLREGDMVEVILKRDERPDDFVELPEALVAALELDENTKAKFDALTPGYKRSLSYWINSAKGIDTKVNRALEIVKRLETGTLKRNTRKEE